MTSTGALNSTLSDNPVEVFHPENGRTPLHFNRQQFFDMLDAYEKRHRVFEDCLRTETTVTGMEEIGEKGWRLTTRSGGTVNVDDFDAVTICTGLNHQPQFPELPGRGDFEGTEIHLDAYDPQHPERFAGQRVLIVGIGESAADLCPELVAGGVDHIYIASRNPTLTLARNFASLPPDHNENRMLYSGPMFHRWALLVTTVGLMLTNIATPTRIAAHKARYWFKILQPTRTFENFPSVMAGANITKSDGHWFELDSGKASLVKPIVEITPTGVRLRDGTELAVDTIIYCTGYTTSNPFFPELSDGHNTPAKQLYKLTVHPKHQNVAVIGFVRGMTGAITISSEMQARWWALLVSEKRQLPTTAEMETHVTYMQRKSRKFVQSTRTTMTFAHSLARHEVGCEPDMFKLLFEDRRLWWRVWNGTMCSAHFRLFGVHAKPDLAKQQLAVYGSSQVDDYVDAVDVVANMVPLSMVLIPIWSLLGKIVPTFQTRGALESYI